MTILEKLHHIEEHRCIYNIHYCNAGVGFTFFEKDRINEPIPDVREIAGNEILMAQPINWKEGLVTYGYYPTFQRAVEAEYRKLKKESP